MYKLFSVPWQSGVPDVESGDRAPPHGPLQPPAGGPGGQAGAVLPGEPLLHGGRQDGRHGCHQRVPVPVPHAALELLGPAVLDTRHPGGASGDP